jgi:hypothetical protein
MRAAPGGRRSVVRVEQGTRREGEAAAADAAREPVANRAERLDTLVELTAPTAREAGPVALRRGPLARERVERTTDAIERDSGCLPRLHERDSPQRDRRIAALVAVGAPRFDQALALVEPQRGLRDAAAPGKFADAQLSAHLT